MEVFRAREREFDAEIMHRAEIIIYRMNKENRSVWHIKKH